MAAERKRDQATINLKRECETLENYCTETNERRVANRLKDVHCCWDQLEKCQHDYLASINVTAIHEDHINELNDSYQLKERSIKIAEDYLWVAECTRKSEEEGNIANIRNKRYRAKMSKMQEGVMQDISDLKMTEENIIEKIDIGSEAHVEAIKFIYEKYSYEFKRLTTNFKDYANEETNNDFLSD